MRRSGGESLRASGDASPAGTYPSPRVPRLTASMVHPAAPDTSRGPGWPMGEVLDAPDDRSWNGRSSCSFAPPAPVVVDVPVPLSKIPPSLDDRPLSSPVARVRPGWRPQRSTRNLIVELSRPTLGTRTPGQVRATTGRTVSQMSHKAVAPIRAVVNSVALLTRPSAHGDPHEQPRALMATRSPRVDERTIRSQTSARCHQGTSLSTRPPHRPPPPGSERSPGQEGTSRTPPAAEHEESSQAPRQSNVTTQRGRAWNQA